MTPAVVVTLLAVLPAALPAQGPTPRAEPVRRLLLESCTIDGARTPARCGTFRVPENRHAGVGRTIALRVIVVPPSDTAGAVESRTEPIVVIPGGPGGSITDAAATWTRILAEARRSRPVLFVDPRGTGGSAALECSTDSIQPHPARYVRDFLPVDRVRACRADLERRADLTQYTTEAIATDLDDLRHALGYSRLVLYGTSGGTRQAMVYLRRYPDRVRALVLAGVVSRDFRMPLHYARDAQAAFDSLAADCAADGECSRAFPRFAQDFSDVLAALERAPARVPLTADDGTRDTAVITRDRFAEQVRTLLYQPARAVALPFIVRRAATGDFRAFIQTLVPGAGGRQPNIVAMGHFLSITCAEDVSRIAAESVATLVVGMFLRDYRVAQQVEACRHWPRAPLPDDHFEAVTSMVPTLLISGAADPVTPPRWAEDARRYLPNSAHLVFPDGGHVPLATPCATRVVARFLETLKPRSLDVSCAASFRRPPFVVSRPGG